MAGVVAMASVIEDFDIQPCKESQNDGGSPVVKTIPNSFSPVPKPLQKPFSPPRPSNIMDYFTRKAPIKTSSPEPLEGDCRKSRLCEKHHSLETEVKRPLQKRSRKAGKAAMKLMELELAKPIEEDCMIVEEQHHKIGTSAQTDEKHFSGDDDINLIEEACFTGEKLNNTATEIVSENEKHHDDKSNIQSQLEGIELSPIVPSKDKAKKVKSNVRRKQQQEETETKSTLSDVSMEVNVDETSQLNNTVIISFEEFLRSQSEDIDEQNTVENVPTVTEEMDTNPDENICSGEPVLQGSPQTVTIHAEVHTVSPKQDAVATKKVASIFNRRKGTTGPLELISPAQMEARQKLPSSGPLVKRKSNVVLEEEDLELAVLESESTPKSTDVERKQFMAAFKQPAVDGSKTKPGKSQGKTKQLIENVEDITETEAEAVVSPTAEEASSVSKKAAKNKLVKKRPKKEENRVRTLPAPVKELVNSDNGGETQEIPVTSSPSTPAVRRSTRGAVVRQSSTLATPVRKPSESKRAAVHPLAKIHRSKHGVFRAEMVCPPDVKHSPIRIKFVRVQKDVPASKSESGCGTACASNIPSNAKKRKQARKLVEKARVIQQSKKASVEEKTILRRSSRTEATAKRSYCEHEDSVICLDEDVMATPKVAEKRKKCLRSLNDVLGKASSLCKDAKPLAGSKAASLGQEKTARKALAVISIFDDSSHESSTNSPDNEQSRARREFLKSGLPESLRKQIAKTTATKEAYSLSCSSFQLVTHTKQTLKDYPLWSLPWPQSSLLSHLQEFWYQTGSPLPPVCSSHLVKTKPACRVFHKLGSTQRPEISESVRHRLIEEVSTSNPLFPAQMFISRLLKRRADHKQQCTAAEADPITRVKTSTLSAKSVGGKRKRRSEEEETAVKVAKKQCRGEEIVSSTDPQRSKRGSRMRRTQRSKPEQEKSDDTNPAAKSEHDPVITILDEDTEKKDDVKEDVLWTDKYHPQHSSDIVGNARAVRRLHSWLREWKLRADREERRKQTDKKQGEDKNDSDWDCREEEFQDGEDMLCNTLLITGPPGVGKTAAVYACAQELGFKVFEVNASSQRSGRLILSQLKEATQSHQVDGQGVNACKPSYFNSYSSSSSSVRPGSSPRKVNSPRTVVSSPRKHPHSPKVVKKGDLAPTSLAHFFKMGRPPNKEATNTKNNEKPSSCKNSTKANVFGSRDQVPAANPPVASISKESICEEQSKKLATSLILFEEVDVIFDDDSGFLSAIKTFMTTTKRPVILTTSDCAFSNMFDGNFEEIHFKAPSVSDSSSFMQLLCLAEDIRTDQWDVSSLLRHNGCDMRQSLLQLQFWARSGGGHCTDRPVTGTAKKAAQLEPLENEYASGSVTSTVPPRDACCTESMLGLLNIAPEQDIWQILRTCRPDEASWWDLLTNCKRRGVELLYSNMEILLPLPRTQLTTSPSDPKQTLSVLEDHPSVPEIGPPSQNLLSSHPVLPPTTEWMECSDDGSTNKVSSGMRKKRHCLPAQDGLDSDSEDDFVSLHKPQIVSQSKEDIRASVVCPQVRRKPLTPEERLKSLPVSQCLQSLGEFFDNLSCMDSMLGDPPKDLRAGALVKDGMTDEARDETDRGSWMIRERSLEITAAVEALSFKKCCISAAEAWDKAKQFEGRLREEAEAELTLPVAAHRDSCSYTQEGPCQPQSIQQRMELMESLVFKGVCGTLCNRPAAAMEYLPALRSICRSEQLREQGKAKRRFLHYLDVIHLGLDKSTLRYLAGDFP